ncbi:hypothetical protein [Methylocella sp.]|uniref:hypothetical protein n=1 Tax=Methylocella sp. TaxID=1978226 RepID=UPI0035B4EFC1
MAATHHLSPATACLCRIFDPDAATRKLEKPFLDKAPTTADYDPYASLYSLTEPARSRSAMISSTFMSMRVPSSDL